MKILDLPQSLELECLCRVPFRNSASLGIVCASWRELVRFPNGVLWTARRTAGYAESNLYVLGGENPVPEQDFFRSQPWRGMMRLGTSTESPCWAHQASLPASFDCSRTAVALLGGEIHVGCGENQMTYIYAPLTNSWRRGADMVRVHSGGQMVTMDGRVYAISGYSNSTQTYMREAERFDPAVGCWELIAPLNEAHCGCAVGVLNGRLFVAGGIDTNDESGWSTEVYDDVSDRWDVAADLPGGRACMGYATVGNRLFVAGGGVDSGGCSEETARTCFYDASRDVWTLGAKLQVARRDPACALFGGALVLLGGSVFNCEVDIDTPRVCEFDEYLRLPTAGGRRARWPPLPTPPVGRDDEGPPQAEGVLETERARRRGRGGLGGEERVSVTIAWEPV